MRNGNKAAGDGNGLVQSKDTVIGSVTDAFSEVPKGIDQFRSQWLDPHAKNGFSVEAAAAKPKLSDSEQQKQLTGALALDIYKGPSEDARKKADKIFDPLLEHQQAA